MVSWSRLPNSRLEKLHDPYQVAHLGLPLPSSCESQEERRPQEAGAYRARAPVLRPWNYCLLHVNRRYCI